MHHCVHDSSRGVNLIVLLLTVLYADERKLTVLMFRARKRLRVIDSVDVLAKNSCVTSESSVKYSASESRPLTTDRITNGNPFSYFLSLSSVKADFMRFVCHPVYVCRITRTKLYSPYIEIGIEIIRGKLI